MKKKIGISIMLALMLLISVIGCGSKDGGNKTTENNNTTVKKGEEGTFTYAISADPGNTLNPITVDDRFGMMAANLIYSPLLKINQDGSENLVLAEKIEASEDGLTYTVKLKEGTKWTDGEALTSEDVVFTYDSINATTENLFVDGKAVEVEAIDDLTVKFTLPVVSASAKELVCAGVNILPKHIFEERGNFDLNLLEDKVIGSGSYKFVEYKTGQHFKFEKNTDYINGEANIETIVFKVIESDDTATLAMQNGEVDAWIGMPDLLEPFEDNKDFEITNYSEGRVAYVRLNSVADSMKDKSYREGILKALNREEIMKAAYTSDKYYELSYSFLPKTNSFYIEDVEKWEQDLEKAKELVKDGSKSLKICYIKTDAAQENQALTIQAQLKEVGIEVELSGVEQPAYVKAAYDRENKEYDMFLGGYIMGTDPDTFGALFVSTKEDMINYNNKDVDRLFNEANTTLDEKERKEKYNELQNIVSEEAIFYPFGSNLRTLVTNSRVTGIEDAKLVPIYTFGDMAKLKLK
ncbi:ABC transporter substrate-binding protein [Miniphocaeibacter massiliensis]|uniref:ABC transporter substrate-binding protein n=1 Tax=Miniphocaeibacter massiliensis TaxID=2041841 RepID=UPI000C1B924A|nr:ABC transporter substrate-binding protein [Miniphocaeibacter massiliensis]